MDPWNELAAWRNLLPKAEASEPAAYSEGPFTSGSVEVDRARNEMFKKVNAQRQTSFTLSNGLNVNYWQGGYEPGQAPSLDPNKLAAQIDFFTNI